MLGRRAELTEKCGATFHLTAMGLLGQLSQHTTHPFVLFFFM